MEAGVALTGIFEGGVDGGDLDGGHVRYTIVRIPGTNPVQYRTRNAGLGPIVRCRRSGSLSWIRAWRSAR